jgi:hypothetical protein
MRKPNRFAVCIQGTGFDLLFQKVYGILDDRKAAEFGSVRVIDESGEDYLYPASWFVLVKPAQGTGTRLTAALLSPPPDKEAVTLPKNSKRARAG